MVKSVLVAWMFLAGFTQAVSLANAAQSNDFVAAYTAAVAAEKKAAALHNQWTTTEAVLKEAVQANKAMHTKQAIALAKKAEALANASVEQAEQQKTEWRNAVIK